MTPPPSTRLRWWTWLALGGAALIGGSCLFGAPTLVLACDPDGACPGTDRCSQGFCLPRWLACGNCVDAGKNCGALDDGCGELLQCGDCTLPQTCAGAGVANVCGCTGQADKELCAFDPSACGPLATTDLCGVQRNVDCGVCGDGGTCGAAQVNICCYGESAAQIIERTGAECGVFDAGDICGNAMLLDAGVCTDGGTCNPASHQCNCHPINEPCGSNAGCCTTLACVNNRCCQPVRAACNDAPDCCGSADCAGGFCCAISGMACSDDDDCCSRKCGSAETVGVCI